MKETVSVPPKDLRPETPEYLYWGRIPCLHRRSFGLCAPPRPTRNPLAYCPTPHLVHHCVQEEQRFFHNIMSAFDTAVVIDKLKAHGYAAVLRTTDGALVTPCIEACEDMRIVTPHGLHAASDPASNSEPHTYPLIHRNVLPRRTVPLQTWRVASR